MADVTDPKLAAELKKKRIFRTFSYRGIELDKLLDLSNEEVRALTATLDFFRLTPPFIQFVDVCFTSHLPGYFGTNPDRYAIQVVHSRARRRFNRGLKRKPLGLIKKLRKAKKEAPPNEKPTMVKTHLRDMIIVPEMIGSVIGVYNGKVRSTPVPLHFGRPCSTRYH